MRDGQPSVTARGAAAYRAIHQTLENGAIFADPFAARILDDEGRAGLLRGLDDRVRRLTDRRLQLGRQVPSAQVRVRFLEFRLVLSGGIRGVDAGGAVRT